MRSIQHAMRVERIEPSEALDRSVVLVVGTELSAIDVRSLVRTPHCIALVVADGASMGEGELYRLGLALLAAGAVYFVAGGPNAARMEWIFDDAILFGEGVDHESRQVRMSTERSVILTVADEDVDQALEFALFHAFPAQDYEDRADTVLVVCREGPNAEKVRAALADVAAFRALIEASG